MPHDQAFAIIMEGKGSHFDPDIVDAFAGITDQFKDIAGHYSD
jgi:cyclic di-GMP phosphodiesterase